MDATTFTENFEVTIAEYKYYPDGQVDMSGNVISDCCDVAWTVKCKTNGHSRKFSVAYNVLDTSLISQQICQEAWKLRKSQIWSWAETMIGVSALVGETFIPE